jgi:ADP-ribose pyrophosphatase YjhB (NUDIX family)
MQQNVKLGIKNQYGEFLMIKREDKEGLPERGRWDVVGGGVERWESPEEAVVREKDEETGGIEVYDIKEIGKFHYHGIEYILFLGKTEASIEDVITEPGQEAGYFNLYKIYSQLDTITNLKDLLIKYRPELESY